jgi:catechol 2,3-dioxygenase-like lactoylglutathione lyase family enzyme
MKALTLPAGAAALVLATAAAAQPPTAPAPDPTAPARPLPAHLKPNRVRASGINVADLEREKAFYVNIFGMQELRRPNPNEIVLGYKVGPNEQATLVLNKATPRAGSTAYGRLILDVPDADTLAEHLRGIGYPARKVGQPTDRAYFISDPEGYQVEIYTPNAP